MQLHVRVVQATDIPKMDFFGKADPYCLLQLYPNKDVRKTRVIENTLSPVWNDEFHFMVTNRMTNVLSILMKDQDKGFADDPISKIEIKLSELAQETVTDKWYDMHPVKGVKKGGRLRLVLHLAGADGVAFMALNAYAHPAMPMYANQPMPMYGQQPMPMYGQQPMYQQQMMGQPMYQQQMMGQPMYGQQMMGQPMMGQQMYGHQMMGQPMMGQPMMGQPMMGQPMMGQPMMGQGMMGRPY